MCKFAIRLEELGFYSGWLFDHVHSVDTSPKGQPLYECWTTLTALAGSTKSLRLGQIVTCNLFRHPSVLAKIAACVDVFSNGRLEFGIGACWLKEEALAYGIQFPSAKDRINMMEEAVQIIKSMWTEEITNFRGKYYKIEGAINYPKPIQKPHPPILIGGSGKKLTMRVVAKHGDRCNFSGTPEEYRHKLDFLRKHCLREGRNYEEIEKTYESSPLPATCGVTIGENEDEVKQLLKKYWIDEKVPNETFDKYVTRIQKTQMAGTPEQIAERIQEYTNIGVTYFILYFNNAIESGLRPLELFSEQVIPFFNS
jgi:F420-dependent oxidoreductase-like protein